MFVRYMMLYIIIVVVDLNKEAPSRLWGSDCHFALPLPEMKEEGLES